MSHSVKLEEVVLTSVTRYFELRAQSVGGSKAFRFYDRGDYVVFVVIKRHSPLVKLAGR